jgi:hypothetical protein
MKFRLNATHAVVATLLTVTALAASATPCDEVISSIDGKLKTRGVSGYTLEAIPVAEVKNQHVVGVCEVGAKKIIYTRTQSTAAAAAPVETPSDQKASPATITPTTTPTTTASVSPTK